MFQVELKPKVIKFLAGAEKKLQVELYKTLKHVRLGSFTLLDIRKVKGRKYGHRIRVRRWRILLNMFSKEQKVEVVDIFLKKGKSDYQKRRELLN